MPASHSEPSPILSEKQLRRLTRRQFLALAPLAGLGVLAFPSLRERFLKAGLAFSDRISEAVRDRLGLPAEKVFNKIQTRGNTTAASIPLAMVEARAAGLLRRGHLVLLLAFGSGFTWGGVLLRY